MKLKKVGMRTVKTIIAVVLTLEISKALNMNSPILAGIAAIMTVEASVSKSFKTGKFRMYGTVLGGVIALLITFLAPTNSITIAIGLFTILYIANLLEWKSAVRMGMIVFLVVIVGYDEGGDRFSYAFNRTIDTFLGVLVGTTINYFIRPPKVEVKIDGIIDEMIDEVRKYVDVLVWDNLKPSLGELKDDLIYIEENYKVLKRDLKLKVYVDDTLSEYNEIFINFQNIQSHLRVIKLLKKRLYIKEENKELLEDMFQKKVPEVEKKELEDLDIIYNYHLEKILCDLKNIEDIYEEIK